MSAPFETLLARRLRAALLAACATCAAPAAPAQPATPAATSAPPGVSPPSAAPAAASTAPALPVSPMSAATAAEIQKINEQMTLLQAQLNQLELKAKIAGKQREINGAGPSPVQSSFDSRSGNPSVLSVAGLKGNLEAVLVFPGGVTQRVRAGDVIDDRRVARVAINEVVLTDLKGRNVQRLAFGSAPLTRERSTTPGAVGAMGASALALPPSLPLAPMPR